VPEEGRAQVELDPVAIFRTDGVSEGWIRRSDLRLSDHLNTGAALHVRLPGVVGIEDWQVLSADDVIAVAVPPHPNPSPRRMARRRHVLELEAPPYHITGTVHMPPGADPARYARAAPHRWLALTQATIEFAGNVFKVEVLLANLDRVLRS